MEREFRFMATGLFEPSEFRRFIDGRDDVYKLYDETTPEFTQIIAHFLRHGVSMVYRTYQHPEIVIACPTLYGQPARVEEVETILKDEARKIGNLEEIAASSTH